MKVLRLALAAPAMAATTLNYHATFVELAARFPAARAGAPRSAKSATSRTSASRTSASPSMRAVRSRRTVVVR